MNQQEYKIDIPKRFFSDVTDEPFKTCNVCGTELLTNEVPYVIEKAVKNYSGHNFSSTIYELAICLKCHTKMQQSMSKESIAKIQNYHAEVMSSKGNQPIMIDMTNFSLDDWLSKCFFKGGDISEMKEYQVVGQFKGDKMIMNTPPLIIGDEAMAEMAGLLSDKTTDEMNGFREKFLGPAPEIEEMIYGKKLIFI